MCGGSIVAKLLFVVFSGTLPGLKTEDTAEVPSPNYEDGYVKPGRLGAAAGDTPLARSSPLAARSSPLAARSSPLAARSSPLAARSPTTIAHSSLVADKSTEWMVALRSSLMRENYDYQPPESETLAPLAGDASGETSAETSDSSGDTSGGTDSNGRPSAQDYDSPTPRSLNHNPPSKDHSFSRRNADPILKPSRVHQNISRKNMYLDTGLELPSEPVGDSHSRSSRRQPRGRALAALTMPPRSAHNAALIDEINEKFEAKRRNYLESLYELEDQLRPVYAGGSPRREDARAQQSADRRGGVDRGTRNHLDDAIGIKPDSLPYIGHDGIRRYKVFKNEIEKFQPFVEDYLDYRPEARVAAGPIPSHKNPQKNQDPMTELHQEALDTMDNVKPTFDESSEYVQDRKPQPSGRRGTTKGDEWYTKHHGRRKKQRSMYLESAGRPDIDSEDSIQRHYNSRRNAELFHDSPDAVGRSPSPTVQLP